MRIAPAILLPLVVCLSSCGPQSETPRGSAGKVDDPVLAQVGTEQITRSGFQGEWARRGRGSLTTASAEQREEFLHELIREKALLLQARATGWDRDPAIVSAVEQLIVTRFTEAQLQNRPNDLTITEAEIRACYETNQTRFQTPAAVRGGFIWFRLSAKADAARRTELLARAERIRAAAVAADAAGFKALVQQHSEDQATRYTGGDLGWLTLDEPLTSHAPVLTALQQLQQPGEVAPLVVTSNGIYIVRLGERRASAVRPLAEVQELLRYELLREKQFRRERKFFEQITEGVAIEINRAELQAIPTAVQAAAAIPSQMPER